MTSPAMIRAGIPLPGGRLVEIARDAGLPVLFSANAFMRRNEFGEITSVRMADRAHFGGLNAALDSGGFVAAQKYNGFPWSVEQYLNLVESYDWAWYASMDHCVEPEIAGDKAGVMFRVAETARMYGELRRAAADRGLPPPMPVLQGWTPSQYVYCAERLPLFEWPDLIGVGSMCRRNLHGEVGVFAVLDALDGILPPHTKIHLFGVKGRSMQHLGQHPRIASIDSLAWDFAARKDHPTGRTMDLRGQYMLDWVEKNRAKAAGAQVSRTASLLPVEAEEVDEQLGAWLNLVTGNEIDGPNPAWHAAQGFEQLFPDEEDEEEDSSESTFAPA
ncbi:DUF7221 family queuine tRNA-ribosyltransferase-like protein [Massilia varians]|uniref:deazapurine DNA modification protein DpdA family protein n=1 Tax=Massilia varians TaxID=457921 RepID=UPI00255727A3|nr:hypothetical protein [Massilia varians]MDK6080354.1 hypothetical protein [Massilia varians]